MNSVFYNNDFEIFKESVEGIHPFPRLVLRGKFQEALAQNNNGRRYTLETLTQKILPRCTKEALSGNALFGESIHPSDDLTGEINTEKIIWRIVEAHMEGDVMKGAVEIIPESPIGKTLYFLVEKYEAKPGISSRGFGRMKGEYVDHDSYRFITFDGTFNPSTHQAFLSKISESGEVKEFIKSFQDKELKTLSENSILRMGDGTSLVENVFNKQSYHIINKKQEMSRENETTELLKETSKQLVSTSNQLTKAQIKINESENLLKEKEAELKEMEDELKKAEKKIKEMEDEMSDKEVKIEKTKKEMEDYEAKKKEESEEKEKLEESYNTALEVIEEMINRYHKVNSHYEKATRVLELVESEKITEKIKNLVEKNLGNYKDYAKVFENVSSLEAAGNLVESLKSVIPSGDSRPFQKSTLFERSERGQNNNSSRDIDEGRVSAYSL